MAVNDIWRLSCIGSENTTDIRVTTMHIKFLTGGATFAGAAAYIKTNLLDLYKSMQAPAWHWDRIAGYKLEIPAQVDEYTTGFPIAGTVGGGTLEPPQVAIVASLRTPYVGRSYRGRMYLPGPANEVVTTGIFTTANKNTLQGYFDDLVAALGDGGSNADYQWVVFSRKLGTTVAGGHITAYDLTKAWPVKSVIVRQIFGTQRRREFGVGG